MGIFDKAKDFASKNPDKADGIVDKAGDMVDERTGGQHAAHVDKGQDFVKGQYGGGQPVDAPPANAEAPEGNLPPDNQPVPEPGAPGEQPPPA
ncbi:MAG: Rv0909 family putative TA system antitoxin [Propionibacteriaceae bacterium]|nr:Rv0909 family putative TA system antitoxin [Propionibacteriaceae bacterium]